MCNAADHRDLVLTFVDKDNILLDVPLLHYLKHVMRLDFLGISC